MPKQLADTMTALFALDPAVKNLVADFFDSHSNLLRTHIEPETEPSVIPLDQRPEGTGPGCKHYYHRGFAANFSPRLDRLKENPVPGFNIDKYWQYTHISGYRHAPLRQMERMDREIANAIGRKPKGWGEVYRDDYAALRALEVAADDAILESAAPQSNVRYFEEDE